MITQRRSRAMERVFDHRQGLTLAPHAAHAQTGCTQATARKGPDAQEGTKAVGYTPLATYVHVLQSDVRFSDQHFQLVAFSGLNV